MEGPKMGGGCLKDHGRRFDDLNRSTFLPMLCARSSMKNVVTPSGSRLLGLDEVDLLSPKIGCMGQVKKRSGRVVGLPTPRMMITGNCNAVGAIKGASNCRNIVMMSCSSNANKYSKMIKLLSGKSLTGIVNSSSLSSTIATTVRTMRRSVSRNCSYGTGMVNNLRGAVNIAEMDPPLPVVKKVRKPEEDEGESLWQRRFRGAAQLRSLEIQRSTSSGIHFRLETV
ncbi:hypothetical protein SAY86_000413 [Trapa natans]|uniref:Uncharacterized protein n=1 Tax=Trapa natans TaxID=22666 RepID=A0AAN7MUB6_TRANT|nr:hypothetical protein SAY86_000413 [Trapa natans]